MTLCHALSRNLGGLGAWKSWPRMLQSAFLGLVMIASIALRFWLQLPMPRSSPSCWSLDCCWSTTTSLATDVLSAEGSSSSVVLFPLVLQYEIWNPMLPGHLPIASRMFHGHCRVPEWRVGGFAVTRAKRVRVSMGWHFQPPSFKRFCSIFSIWQSVDSHFVCHHLPLVKLTFRAQLGAGTCQAGAWNKRICSL